MYNNLPVLSWESTLIVSGVLIESGRPFVSAVVVVAVVVVAAVGDDVMIVGVAEVVVDV